MWTLPRICWDSKFEFGNTSPQGIRSLFIDGCAHLWLSHCSYCHLFCHVVMFLAIWVPLSTTTITGDLFLLCCENKLELHVKFCSKVTFWQNWKIAKMALLSPCMKFKNVFGQKTSFEALWKCHLQKVSITCPRVQQIQNLYHKKYKKGIF